MLLGFFEHLRKYRVPVSVREYLDMLALLKSHLVFADQDDFYFMSRLALVKDEKYYDRFDLAFASYFDGMDQWVGVFDDDAEELRQELLRHVRENQESRDALREYREKVKEIREALAEAREESDATVGAALLAADDSPADDGHSGAGEASEEGGEGDEGGEGGEGGEGEGDGDGEEGDGGEEGKGNDGDRGEGLSEKGEEGERTEATEDQRQRATKVWLNREFADYDPDVELGTRNLKMALRRLRRWAREAADLELDLHDTIRSTAANGGILDIKEVPERHNAVKVLMLFDVGGSMDEHVELCAQLFSAARTEFKHLEFYYFHNFLYESIWRDNERRLEDRIPTWHLLQKFGRDYKVIFVGDADMARHEVSDRGGSVEHFNAEPGEVWLQRLQDQFRSVVWLNPLPESRWQDSFSIQMIKRRLDDQMYFLSDTGLASAMKSLMR